MRWVKHHSRRDPRTGELVTVPSHFKPEPLPRIKYVCTICHYEHKYGDPCDWSKPLRQRPPKQLKLL